MPDSRPTPPSEPNARGPRSHNAGRPSDGRDSARRRQGREGRNNSGQERRGRGQASRDNRSQGRGRSQESRGRGRRDQNREPQSHRREGRRPRDHARPFKPFTPEQLAERAAAIPIISFPDLPVSARRDEIARAIRDHQVVIVSGETGSGKTTQLPKICMQLGRGVAALEGVTPPKSHAIPLGQFLSAA